MLNAADGFVKDEKRNYHQRCRIHQRGQHSRAVISVGMRRARRARMQIHRQQRQQQRDKVSEIVSGLGKQRQRMRANSRNHQQNNVGGSYRQRNAQNPRGPLIPGMVTWTCTALV